MITKLELCMLFLTCAVALEMYDENRPFGMDQNNDDNYNEGNSDYEDLGPYQPDIRDDQVQNLMLYQLFNSLQNRDDIRLHMRYRPKFSMAENPLAGYGHIPYSALMDFKGAVVKRNPGGAQASAENTGHQVKRANPKEIQLKGKNSRKGRISLCYLKLCTYPRPLIQK